MDVHNLSLAIMITAPTMALEVADMTQHLYVATSRIHSQPYAQVHQAMHHAAPDEVVKEFFDFRTMRGFSSWK